MAATRHMSKHSVSDVINIAKEKEIIYEKVKQLSEDEVYRMIFPDKFAIENLYEQSDYEYVHQELKRVGVTLKLLWQEYQDNSLLVRCHIFIKKLAEFWLFVNSLDNSPQNTCLKKSL